MIRILYIYKLGIENKYLPKVKLKVVRYKNYGLKNSNAGEIIEHKFYYSFYELYQVSINYSYC